MEYKLEDLIDIPLLQDLQEKLNLVYSFPSAIIDNEGKVLTAVAWQDICTKFHRRNPECEKECIKSDQYILDHLHEANPAVSYTCPHGLVDNATPIIINEKHLGNFFTGQFFLEKPDLNFFKEQARKYGFEEKSYIKAVEQVPIWTKEKLNLYLDFIKGFIEIIAGIGLKNLNEIKVNKEYKKINEELVIAKEKIEESEILNRTILNTSPDIIYIYDIIERKNIYSNNGIKKLLGYSVEEIQKMGENLISNLMHPDDFKVYLNKIIPKYMSAKDEEIIEHEYRMQHKKGSWHWLSSKELVFLRSTDGTPRQIFGLIRDITEAKESKEKLKESEEKFRYIAENISAMIFITDTKGLITYASPSTKKILGYSDIEVINKNFIEFLADKEKARILQKFQESIASAKTSDYISLEIVKKNGENCYVEVQSNILLKDGKVDGVIGTITDVTDKRRAERDLRESEEKYRKLVELSPDAVLIHIDGIVQFANSASVSLFEANEKSDLIGKKIIDFVHPEFQKIVKQRIGEILDKETDAPLIEEKLITLKGNHFFAEVSALPISLNEKSGVQVVARDITERKMAKELLLQAKKDWEESFDSITDMITLHDQEYNIISANRAAKKLLEIPDIESTLKNKCHFYYHGTEIPPLNCASCECLKDGKMRVNEFFEPHLDRYIEIRAIPRFDKDDQLQGVVHIVRDITDRKIAEQDLLNAKEKAEESDRLKSAFLANMSHEIRTPMNGILGFAELLKSPELSGEKQKEFLKIIEQSGERMLDIINDIINISKVDSGLMELTVEEANVNKQMDYIYAFFKPEIEKSGLLFKLDKPLPNDEVNIQLDFQKFNSIMTNLVKNAIKFTVKGSIDIGYVKKNNTLEFYVKDTGIGIESDQKEIIFERFRQGSELLNRKYEGFGLGLSISKAYIEMMGGEIRVESEAGKGSVFYFSLPYNIVLTGDTKTASLIDPTLNNVNKVLKLKVLIVEDDEASRFLNKTLIESYSREILFAINGIEAVNICKKNPDIDLILMDVKLPKMDGYEATREIRQFNKDVLIIAQTAFALSGDKEKAIEAGCNNYISKPMKKEHLMDILAMYFN